MFIQTAYILCKDQKTDDELKALMATHPWAPSLMHGFYKSFGGTWKENVGRGAGFGINAIWTDAGITAYDPDEKWIVENFHTPDPCCFLDDLLLDDPHLRRLNMLKEAWWDATTALILHQVPAEYQVYTVYYGEIVDEFDNPEEAWREGLLATFNYAPKVLAALGLEVRS